MPYADFVHLRVHSAYSLSEGALKVDKIAALAAELAMPAVGIADTSNLFGALEFSEACRARGVQPILGCQIALARPDQPRLPPDPLVLLAQNAAGFANLQKLSSRSFLDTEPGLKPQLPLDTIRAHAEGLLLLTGGARGPAGRLLAEGQRGEAVSLLTALNEAFEDRLVVEIQRHGDPLERAVEPGLIALADERALPLAATNECFFASRKMHEAHDALLCIAEGRVLAEPDRRRETPEHWFKPAAEMRALFADLPEACDNTLAIARLCAAMAETRKPLLPVSPKVRPGTTEAQTLAALAREGLAARLATSGVAAAERASYTERLEFELGVITKMGFPGYFLIVADFIQWAKSQAIAVGPGRGSGAGSLVAWALTITDLDPLRYGLLFERFLNPERVSMPDFDIDFCQDRRDEVIRYVTAEYGADRVAQIITFGKLQARAAVRDTGRVLGLPYGQVNKVAELIPNNPAKPVTLKEAIDGEPRLQEMRADESVNRLMEIALQLEGLYRHASTHAAGVVIGDRPLIELVPLYKDPRSELLITQYSMKHVELAGLVKFDFLGLTTLTVLQRALHFLEAQGIAVDLAQIPLDDPKTYEMLARGDTAGVFTFETQGYRDALRQMRPDRFEDLIALQALNRPGPMANIPAYCARKHGESWEPPHPDLAGILGETYGIMVYQEQVMQIAQLMAGYSLGAADMLRRAMGKKIRAEMDAQRKIFVEGAREKGYSEAKAVEVFELMAKFADYGFNKSHAAAYALVSYQSAWLRANHPVAFMAATMSLARANTDRLASLKQDAARMGIAILPPDVNRSGADFTIETRTDGAQAIRYALAAVKRVGEGAMEALVRARGDSPFQSLADFAARIDAGTLNRAQVETLAKAGAFECIEPNRARVFTAAELLIRHAQSAAEERGSGQIGLFGGPAAGPEPIRLPDLPDWPPLERLNFEAEAIGFHLSAHPLDMYAVALRRLGAITSGQLAIRARNGSARVKLAGVVTGRKERITRTGSRMAWVSLSDADGGFEITLFSEVLGRVRDLLAEGTALLVTADLQLQQETLRITAQDVVSLETAASQAGTGLRVFLDRAEALGPIKSLLDREGRGRGRVLLVPRLDATRSLELALPGGFNVSPRLAQAMKLVSGVELVEEV